MDASCDTEINLERSIYTTKPKLERRIKYVDHWLAFWFCWTGLGGVLLIGSLISAARNTTVFTGLFISGFVGGIMIGLPITMELWKKKSYLNSCLDVIDHFSLFANHHEVFVKDPKDYTIPMLLGEVSVILDMLAIRTRNNTPKGEIGMVLLKDCVWRMEKECCIYKDIMDAKIGFVMQRLGFGVCFSLGLTKDVDDFSHYLENILTDAIEEELHEPIFFRTQWCVC